MKMPHHVIVKAPGLLPMLYKVSELAGELGLPERTLRDWLDAGAPHQRDPLNHIWINGRAFKQWIQEQRKPKRTVKLLDHQAYCLRCNKAVELQSPERHLIKGKLVNIKGTCPQCGCSINRGATSGTQVSASSHLGSVKVVVRSIPEPQTDQLIERRNYELVTEYLNSLVEDAQIAQVTVARYSFYLRHLLFWASEIPFTKASTIRPTLMAYLDRPLSPESKVLASETRKKIVELARKFFEWAKMNHPTEFKPLPPAWIQKLKLLRKHSSHTETEPLFVALDEAISLATTPSMDGDLAHWRDRAMAARLILTGERANAAVTSPILAIDFDRLTLKQWPELGVKTKNSKRATTFLLPITELIEVARSWDEYVRKRLPLTTPWYAPIDNQWGEQKLSEADPGKNRSVGINKRLRILFEKAGLPYKSAHKFRHGHAAYGLLHCQTMADYKAVSLNLMHESLEITDRIYVHLRLDDMRNRISKLADQDIKAPNDELLQYLAHLSKSERIRAIGFLANTLA